ncbi:MAG TPA: pyridoxal phosphate-dependent aminotransferase [Pseudomonadota bacterium]|nr:pyridoxal phosphate-dependent aminotransferase [Pseudomonadota bacterium]
MTPAGRFSGRLPWDTPPNRLSVAVAQARAGGAPLLDLTVSNPTRAMPELYPAELLLPLAQERGLHYEPSPQGADEARQSIAAYYAARATRAGRAVQVLPEHLVLCASTSEAYTWLFQLLCDPGQSVLYPKPSYPLLEFLAGLAAARLQPYSLSFDGGRTGRWWLDTAALHKACTADTRAVVVVSPNNPTGSLLRRSELGALCALCRERDLALIVDEVFADYALGSAPTEPAAAAREAADPLIHSVLAAVQELGAAAPLCFVLSGLSKVLGLPQLKLGWVHVGGPEPLRRQAQDRLELIADTFLSVGTPVQLAAPRLLGEQPRVRAAIVARLRENLELLGAAVHDTACQLLPVEGGWYAVLRLPRLMSEEEWALLLLERDRVLVHPGYFYDFAQEAYLVLSLLCPPAVLAEGARRLVARVAAA